MWNMSLLLPLTVDFIYFFVVEMLSMKFDFFKRNCRLNWSADIQLVAVF